MGFDAGVHNREEIRGLDMMCDNYYFCIVDINLGANNKLYRHFTDK